MGRLWDVDSLRQFVSLKGEDSDPHYNLVRYRIYLLD